MVSSVSQGWFILRRCVDAVPFNAVADLFVLHRGWRLSCSSPLKGLGGVFWRVSSLKNHDIRQLFSILASSGAYPYRTEQSWRERECVFIFIYFIFIRVWSNWCGTTITFVANFIWNGHIMHSWRWGVRSVAGWETVQPSAGNYVLMKSTNYIPYVCVDMTWLKTSFSLCY